LFGGYLSLQLLPNRVMSETLTEALPLSNWSLRMRDNLLITCERYCHSFQILMQLRCLPFSIERPEKPAISLFITMSEEFA
jgi:hypothetical protein